MTRADLWEIRLAVEATLDRHSGSPCSVTDAVDAVCEMHGLDDPLDRAIVTRGVILRLAPRKRAA